MSDRRGLWIAAGLGLVTAVVGEELIDELLWQIARPWLVQHYTLSNLLYGGIGIALGLLAAALCRWFALRQGVSRRQALGVGLATGAGSIAWGFQHGVWSAVWTGDGIRDIPLLGQSQEILLATVVIVALRVAGVGWLHVLGVTVVIWLVRYGVHQIDLVLFLGDEVSFEDYDRLDLLERIRHRVLAVVLPAVAAAGAVVLPRRTSEEQVAV